MQLRSIPALILVALALPALAGVERVAVLEFDNKKLSAADKAVLDRSYFSDHVRISAVDVLRGNPGYGLITRENMREIAAAQGVDLAACDDEKLCEVEKGRMLSASLVVSGELLKVGSFFKLVLKLHDTRDGAILSGAEASGTTPDELLANTDQAVAKLLEPLGALASQKGPPGTGAARLTILSQPQASAQLDGQELGLTPVKKRAVEPGAHLIVLTARGYHAASRTIDVRAGEESTVSEKLFHQAGALEIVATDGASLSLDGNAVHAGRVDGLAVGQHTVRGELKGYRAAERAVDVENGTTSRVDLQLQPLPRRVVVIPSLLASCTLDNGVPQESQPDKPTSFEAPPGMHQISCTRRGYAQFTQAVSVRPGSDVVVNAQLTEGGPAAGDMRKDTRIGLASVFIPAATFAMGCVPGDRLCATDERPTRTVSVPNFWLTRTEVDVDAYKRCVDAGACSAPDTDSDSCNWGRRPDHPVNCVDWYQASDYCRWAGGALPTAAEWEYAARSGGSAPYPWGSEPPSAAHARYDSLDGTMPVASYQRGMSRWGLADLSGNVAEWTASDYSIKEKEVRGGGWTDTAKNLRASARFAQKSGARSDVIGFRCAFHEATISQ